MNRPTAARSLLPDDDTPLADPPAAPNRQASPVSAVVADVLTLGAELGPDTNRSSAALTEERFWFRRRADGADLMLPGEQWHHEVRPRRLWIAEDDPDRLVVDVRSS